MPVVTQNRRARHEYEILETFEAGIALSGQEVKSAKYGRMSLKGAYVVPRGNELRLIGATIPPYQPLNAPAGYDEERSRRLLLRRKEIDYLIGKARQKGLTIIPTRVYTRRGLVKAEIAVAKRKRKPDKRRQIKEREEQRKIEREMKRQR